MVHYTGRDFDLSVTKTDKIVRIATDGLVPKDMPSSDVYIEIYKDKQKRELLFASNKITTVAGSDKFIVLDLSFANSIEIDPFVIVVGVVGKFNKKYLVRER